MKSGSNFLWLIFIELCFPDVPGNSTRASPVHPGQQLCGGTWLDWHPDQSQPVQPQALKHLPSLSLPQRPLALLQALGRRSPWVYTLHRVRKVLKVCPASLDCGELCSHLFVHVHLFSAVSQPTSSWTWMETERQRGFIPCSLHTWQKWSKCKVRR